MQVALLSVITQNIDHWSHVANSFCMFSALSSQLIRIHITKAFLACIKLVWELQPQANQSSLIHWLGTDFKRNGHSTLPSRFCLWMVLAHVPRWEPQPAAVWDLIYLPLLSDLFVRTSYAMLCLVLFGRWWALQCCLSLLPSDPFLWFLSGALASRIDLIARDCQRFLWFYGSLCVCNKVESICRVKTLPHGCKMRVMYHQLESFLLWLPWGQWVENSCIPLLMFSWSIGQNWQKGALCIPLPVFESVFEFPWISCRCKQVLYVETTLPFTNTFEVFWIFLQWRYDSSWNSMPECLRI